jgi:hypothetical protein
MEQGCWRFAVWVLKVNISLLIIDFLILALMSFFLKVNIVNIVVFSMLLLLESGITFLVGGILVISSSIFPSKIREQIFHTEKSLSLEKHQRSQKKANQYILVGVFLFFEALILSLVL